MRRLWLQADRGGPDGFVAASPSMGRASAGRLTTLRTRAGRMRGALDQPIKRILDLDEVEFASVGQPFGFFDKPPALLLVLLGRGLWLLRHAIPSRQSKSATQLRAV